MKRAFFLSDRCQEIANILYEHRAYLEESYCSNILKRLEPFADKMNDELNPEDIQKIDQLLDNIRKCIPSNTPASNITPSIIPERLNPFSSTAVSESPSNFDDLISVIKKIVMTAISGTTVYGDQTITQIAFALLFIVQQRCIS